MHRPIRLGWGRVWMCVPHQKLRPGLPNAPDKIVLSHPVLKTGAKKV